MPMDRAEIYPVGWSSSDEDRQSIASAYEDLRRFFATAAANREEIVAWLS
jgi:hypothetical protein